MILVLASIMLSVEQSRFKKKREQFDAPRQHELDDAPVKLAAAREAVDEALVNQKLTSDARGFLDSRKQAVFALDLPADPADGLAEVLNTRFEITTNSRQRVLRLVDSMRGASIGVAGPRGVGKTTLLWSLHQSGETDPDVLSVFTSAPVQYDPRDFLLYLFSSVCDRVMEKQKGVRESSPWRQIEELRDSSLRSQLLRMRQFASLATSLGLILLVASGLLVVANVSAARSASASQPSTADSSTKPIQHATAPASGSLAGSTLKKRTGDFDAIMTALDLKPAPFLLWGLILFISGMYLERYGNPRGLMSGRLLKAIPILVGARQDREQEAGDEQERDAKLDVLGKEARRLQMVIRFQQSYSSGWTGSLKLPVGIEGGINSALQWAERQQTLPEVVAEYRTFLQRVTQRYHRVILAVDELDKLESDEVAQKFLNGIKAIFGQQGCYYLISVSQNAMSSFERRGLPFRDAFDSSFDDVLQLDYLNLESSRRLIARRVMNVPHPFICFCYVMAGGLPRDLIRQCRALFEKRCAGAGPDVQLHGLCESLVMADWESKLTAITVEAQKIPLERQTAKFIEVISAVGSRSPDAPMWSRLEDADRCRQELSQAPEERDDEGVTKARKSLLSLHQEVRSYLYFLATVMDVFGPTLNANTWNSYVANNTFGRLARVRQWMAINHEVAVLGTEALRRDLNLRVLAPKAARGGDAPTELGRP